MDANHTDIDDVRRNEQLWQDYRQNLLRYIRQRVDERDAEDVLHDALVKAWQGLDDLHSGTKLSAWLYRITHNAIVDYYRSRRRMEPLDEDPGIEAPEQSNFAEQELARCLQPMIEHLPEKYRDAVYMAELEGRRQHEIAAREGISVSGAKSRVQRGRSRLKEMLEECCSIELKAGGGVAGFERTAKCGDC